MTDPRRALPSVDRLLGSPSFAPLLASFPRDLVLRAAQSELGRARDQLARGSTAPDAASLAARVHDAVARLGAGSVLPVLNATGVVLHTNLGRAPLAEAAVHAMRDVAGSYCTLEYDLERGARGSRYLHCRDLLTQLTGAEDALVVNNNAAALVLALNTLARDREAVISRGELVEIGGAFRVPEIMQRSGARLREVGATNRTHPDDYRGAVGPHTGAILKVHPSNFTIEGYTAEVGVAELARIAGEARVPLIHDIGSGLLLEPARLGLSGEPTPRESLRAGADVVTLSGDKLLGGPQCGIILGSSHHVARMRGNPLCRALRVDKLTLAALAATLFLYFDEGRALREIPVLRMLATPAAELASRAERLIGRLAAVGVAAEAAPSASSVGGGAAPGMAVPTTLVLLGVAMPASRLERRLREGRPAVIARIVEDRVGLDLRTVDPAMEDDLVAAVQRAAMEAP